MLIPAFLVPILLIVFLASVIRSTFGFGESLVAVPLLALCMPLKQAVPLSVLMSISIAAIIVLQDWRQIHFRSAGSLILYTLIGSPLGLLLLTRTDEATVKVILGLVILAFSLYCLLGKQLKQLKIDDPYWLFACGLLAGILGGAYGLNGPPLVIYGAKRRWSAQHFRATLQGYFLVASIAGMIGFWLTGLIIPAVINYYLLSLPVLILAVFIGRAINQRLAGGGFFKYVYFFLLLISIFLLVKSII